MYISKIIIALLTVAAIVLVPSIATAQPTTYTFLEDDANWNTAGHWDPDTGPPEAGDTAIIPDDTICRIKTFDQAAANVEVQSGGKLVIESKKLLLDELGSLGVDGTLELNNTASAPGVLAWVGGLDITGSGTIDAGDGLMTPDSGSGDLAIGTAGAGGPTIKGNVSIAPAGDLHNYGTLLVDDSSDTMTLGKLSSSGTLRFLRGSGDMEVTAGLMKLGRMAMVGFFPAAWTGTITVNGPNATLHLTEHVNSQQGFGSVVLDGGGKIDLDCNWSSLRGFKFSDGTFEIAAGKEALFQ